MGNGGLKYGVFERRNRNGWISSWVGWWNYCMLAQYKYIQVKVRRPSE